MSAALAVVPRAGHPDKAAEPSITLAMRRALGLLHAGALYREAGWWRSRAFPDERVPDATVKGLEQRGLVLMQEYEGLYGVRRACIVITPHGRRLYRDKGGVRASLTAPPVAAEAVLREVEMALSLLDRESDALSRELTDIASSRLDASRKVMAAQARLTAIEARLAKLELTRQNLDARRVDLRALVAAAGERLCAELAEARS